VSKVNEDPNPMPSDSGGGGGQDPDQGKDFRYLDPVVGVVGSEPSYNTAPPGAGSGGSGPSMAADPGQMRIDLGSLRSAELNLLSGTQQAGSMYQDLRTSVMTAATADYYWGPPAPGPDSVYNPAMAHDGLGDGGYDPEAGDQQTLSDMGKEFGTIIDPLMEKALYQVAGALEVLGVFITTLNVTGQSYAQIDQATKFPEPPS
jgi:hypothetical protein